MTENAERMSSADLPEPVIGTGVAVGTAKDVSIADFQHYPSVPAQLAEQRVQLQTLQANFARLREMVEALERAIVTSKAEPAEASGLEVNVVGRVVLDDDAGEVELDERDVELRD